MEKDLVERINHHVKELRLDPQLSTLAELLMYETEKHPPLDFAFLYSNTQDNQASVFGGAAELKQNGLADSFLVIGSDDVTTGFPGYTRWSRELEAIMGPNISPVTLLPMKKDKYSILNVNNLSESESLVAHATEHNIGALYVVAWNVQQLRAVMTAASVVCSKNSPLNLFSHSGTNLPWDETVYHSQGIDRGTRKEFVRKELERIVKYQEQGDIMSAEEVISYMNRRTLPPAAATVK